MSDATVLPDAANKTVHSAPPPSMADRSLVQLTLVRFREFWREPEAIFWVFIFPVLLAGGLGIAFRNRPADVLKVGAAAPEIARALSRDKSLSVEVFGLAAGEEALRVGRIALLAVPAPAGGVVYRYDDTNPDGRMARLLADRAVQQAAGRPEPVPASDKLVREAGSRYIDFLLPGLLGMNLMGSGIWGIGFAIVDARRKKLLKRFVATPMSRGQYLLSFMLSRLVLLFVEVVALVGFGAWIFGVPVRAPLAELAFLCLLASFSFSALGLLIASRVRTIEGASGLMNFVMLPMWILSGVFFSAQRFPEMLQPVIKLLPLTAVIDALRAAMLRGATLPQLTGELAVMAGWLALSFTLALKLFRWR